MKRITFWLMSTLTALVLLFGYHTSTSSTASAQGGNSSAIAPVTGGTGTTSSGTGTTTGGTTADGTTPDGTATSSGSAASSSAAPSTGSGSSTGSGTVTGSVAQTRWGPVQVQLTVSSGKITDVSVLQYPNGNGRDQEINAR